VTALLLDTHTFIWLSENHSSLPAPLKDQIDTADTVYLSIASLWEIAIKVQLGKLALNQPYEAIGIELAASASDIKLWSVPLVLSMRFVLFNISVLAQETTLKTVINGSISSHRMKSSRKSDKPESRQSWSLRTMTK
jgi:hypothetical protein